MIHDGVFNLLPLRGEKMDRPSMQGVIDVFDPVDLKLYADTDSMLALKIDNPPEIIPQLP